MKRSLVSNTMNHADRQLLAVTRRHFFGGCAMGIGSLGLASLLAGGNLGRVAQANEPKALRNPLEPQPPHFAPRAKSASFRYPAGGPSQLATFDYKPQLAELNGQAIPDSYLAGKRFAFTGSSHRTNLLGPKRSFQQYGKNGAWVSD